MTVTIGTTTLLAAFLLVGSAACNDSGNLPRGRDNSSTCCECGCSQDGLVCLSITVEGSEGDSCDDLCNSACGRHAECATAETVAECPFEGTEDRNDKPGPGCLTDDDRDDCDPNPPAP